MSTFPVQMAGTTNTLLWTNEWEIEPQALEQIRKVSNLAPVEYVRVMPDVHMGVGASIGTVIGMRDAIVPSAVGVDIGCGVSAVRIANLHRKHIDDLVLHELRLAVEETIPVGFNLYENSVNIRKRFNMEFEYVTTWSLFEKLFADVNHLRGKAEHQLGTLGGGNHFIELCEGEDGYLWMTLHSGSRNIGKEIAEWHIKRAKALPTNKGLGDLAFFRRGSAEFAEYISDLHWAQGYAKANRTVMMNLFKAVIEDFFPESLFEYEISCHHNYVKNEVIDGEDLIVTRKGAISAQEGELGVIPGNMADGSYVVRGLGNELSLYSAAHGAGRTMSRGRAKSTFTLDDLIEQTEGIEARKDAGIIDEIPGAYKDFNTVMDAQRDLVEPVTHLKTLMCVKG